MKVLCCPTEEIVANYSNKPTQGILFIRQRIETKDFGVCKSCYEWVLRKYDLWDKKEAELMNE